jgi:hypothetical protein
MLVAVEAVDPTAEYLNDDWSDGAEKTEESARLVKKMLLDAGFLKANIKELYTEDATTTEVIFHLGSLKTKNAADLVVLYFTCHGGTRKVQGGGEEQALYLHDRKFGVSEVAAMVRRIVSRCVVIEDACNTGEPPFVLRLWRKPKGMAGRTDGELSRGPYLKGTLRAASAEAGPNLIYYGAATESTDGNLFTELLLQLSPTANDYCELASKLESAVQAKSNWQDPVFFSDYAKFVYSVPFAI